MKREGKPGKIAFLGLFGQQNLGNDCTLQAMIHHTRKLVPRSKLLCICTGTEEISRRYGIQVFDMYAKTAKSLKNNAINFGGGLSKAVARAWRELLHGIQAYKALRGSDLLIVPGTGLLIDETTGPGGYPFYVLKWGMLAKLCRCKFLIVSMGAGPIERPLSRIFIKAALSLADYRSYRDTFSRDYLTKLGFRTDRDPILPDLAFSLPESMMMMTEPGRVLSSPVVGIGLIDYTGQGSKQGQRGQAVYAKYIEETGDFIARLLLEGYRVQLLIGDLAYDADALKDIVALVGTLGYAPDGGQLIQEPIGSVEDLVRQLAGVDIVISPRFHNIILALMLNKRVIALSYNEKFESLMREFALERFCLPLEGLEAQSQLARLADVERDHARLGARIREKAESYRQALDRQYEVVLRY